MRKEFTVTDQKTRWGTIPTVRREGNTVSFEFPAIMSQRERSAARRSAVAWIATNLEETRGVERYRFDAGSVKNAF